MLRGRETLGKPHKFPQVNSSMALDISNKTLGPDAQGVGRDDYEGKLAFHKLVKDLVGTNADLACVPAVISFFPLTYI